MTATINNLYRTSTEWALLLNLIAENDGEVTDEIAAQMSGLINSGQSTIEDAILAKRNLELIAENAKAQARMFQLEYERCRAIADTWENAANKIGTAMIPVLEITGKIQTVAGTAFIRKTPNYSFTLKEGVQFFELPTDCWRQRDPELNKSVLRELAQADRLPEQVNMTKSETVSVCIKRPSTSKNIEATEKQGVAA